MRLLRDAGKALGLAIVVFGAWVVAVAVTWASFLAWAYGRDGYGGPTGGLELVIEAYGRPACFVCLGLLLMGLGTFVVRRWDRLLADRRVLWCVAIVAVLALAAVVALILETFSSGVIGYVEEW